MNIGETLTTLRKKRRLSRQAFADELGISVHTYIKYETQNVKPTYETLCKIADFYGVTTDYLLGRETASEQETLSSLNLTETEKVFIRNYAKLNPEKRKYFVEMLSELTKNAWFSFQKSKNSFLKENLTKI